MSDRAVSVWTSQEPWGLIEGRYILLLPATQNVQKAIFEQ